MQAETSVDQSGGEREAADTQGSEELSTAELLGWAEFACWTMLVLAPFLYYVNGPSVSTDQFVVRTGLVVLSASGAVVLRLVNWRRSRRSRNTRPNDD